VPVYKYPKYKEEEDFADDLSQYDEDIDEEYDHRKDEEVN
jgi:hypothetical protein